jgi:very-short-patch-repair endonuclease
MDLSGRKHTSRIMYHSARQLRKNMTPSEKRLWERLRGRRLNGLKFRRQAPIGPFVADFYHAETRLVIEIDGGIHTLRIESDELRTKRFQEFGYTVIRFKNEELERDIDSVLNRIMETIAELQTGVI